MKNANAIVFIAADDEKPVLELGGGRLSVDKESDKISIGRVLWGWLKSCLSLAFRRFRFLSHNSGRSVRVFFINRRRIKLDNETSDSCIPFVYKRVQERFRANGWQLESFDHIYICCHLGGDGVEELYKRTCELESQTPKNWTCIAISRGNKQPSWWVDDNRKLKTLDTDELIEKIEESSVAIKEEMRKPERIVSHLTNTISQFDTTCLPRQNTEGRVIVIGWPYEEGQLESLKESLFEKRGAAEVFIINKNGVVDSTWPGWNGNFLSKDCILNFHKNYPDAMIFALSIIPFGSEDDTSVHGAFTDWMFVGWVDIFGKNRVRFYTKDDDIVKAMLFDLYSKEINHGIRSDAYNCHIQERHNYLMNSMQH